MLTLLIRHLPAVNGPAGSLTQFFLSGAQYKQTTVITNERYL